MRLHTLHKMGRFGQTAYRITPELSQLELLCVRFFENNLRRFVVWRVSSKSIHRQSIFENWPL